MLNWQQCFRDIGQQYSVHDVLDEDSQWNQMESDNPQATIPRRQKNVVITKKKICKSKSGSNDNYNDEDDTLYNVIVK